MSVKLEKLEELEYSDEELVDILCDSVDEARVGIFWYTDEYDIIDFTEHEKGTPFEDHYTVWYKLKNAGWLKSPYRESEWNTYSRGRVEYNGYVQNKPYTVYSGEVCINGECNNKAFVSMVKNIYRLKDADTKWQYSAHYDRSKDMSLYEIDGSEKEDGD